MQLFAQDGFDGRVLRELTLAVNVGGAGFIDRIHIVVGTKLSTPAFKEREPFLLVSCRIHHKNSTYLKTPVNLELSHCSNVFLVVRLSKSHSR